MASDESSPSRSRPLEARLLDWLADRFGHDGRLGVPIGDDAACLAIPGSRQCVLATDMLLAGVHFEPPPESPWDRIGQKALGVNLSDLAAMGARPAAALISLALPHGTSDAEVQSLYRGMQRLADRFDVGIAGGDTNVWSGNLVINVAVVGLPVAQTVWRRSGGRAGDLLVVTGTLGGSLLQKHWCAEPRIPTAVCLAEAGIDVHAAIDVSDGLALDLHRLAQASRCGAVLTEKAIPVSGDARVLSSRCPEGPSPFDRALADGEDFELLLAMSDSEHERASRLPDLPTPLLVVGRLTAEPGLWLEDATGRRRRLPPRGYLHGG